MNKESRLEIVHKSSMICDMLEHLLDSEALAENEHWLSLGESAYNTLYELNATVTGKTAAEYKLKDIIRKKSFRKGEFTLASGATSKYFFDLKPTMLDPAGANLIANEVIERMTHLKDCYGPYDAIGGVAIGAIPIATLVSAKTYTWAEPLPAFFVRPQAKDHGTKKVVEGDIEPGMKLLLIEDVTTTGGSTLAAVKALRDLECYVQDVIVVVDRMEGAIANLAAENVTLHPIFTRMDFDEEEDL